MGREGDKDCLSGLEKIDWIREIAPSKVKTCRHRTYTEAERKFLDYIDEALEETFFSFFKLKSIDYGDEKHKFVFPIMSCDPLRVALWNEVQNLTVPDSPPPPESLPDNHRALDLQKEREYRKIPKLEYDTPYGINYSATTTTDDLELAKTRKRNYVKAPQQFQEWYAAVIEWTTKLRESSKNHGWTVIDHDLYDENWKPPKKVVVKETLTSLRAEIAELTKTVTKLEKANAKLQEQQNAKKRKLNKDGGPSGAVDTSAEVARQVTQWKEVYSAENVTLKSENQSLKNKYESEVKNHAKTAVSLGDEKAAKKDLERDMAHQKELNTAKVGYLEKRIQELKDDKGQYMSKVLGAPQASQSLRNSGQNHHLESRVFTPTDTETDQGRFRASGSAQSP